VVGIPYARLLGVAAITCLLQTGVPERTASLPRATGNDGYVGVMARFHASVPRRACDNCQIHSELRIVTVKGETTRATVDEWLAANFWRLKETAVNWYLDVYSDGSRRWQVQHGFAPMRLWEMDGFRDLFPRPGPAERRIRVYAPKVLKLERRKIKGVRFSCSGPFAGAEICFDAELGFPIEATVDQEQVVYAEWAKFGDIFYPSRLALYRGRRLQMEAVTRIRALTPSDGGIFRAPDGAEVLSAVNGWFHFDNDPRAFTQDVDTTLFGDAQVKIFVDDTGKVRRAELLDADDEDLGAAALRAARLVVYAPDRGSGERQAFEGQFFVSRWSTVDPMSVEVTSLASQGTD
jgi:hypothetical protein